MEVKVLIYGTRTSKDKSGAYLFLPDSEAKVADAREPARPGGRGVGWGGGACRAWWTGGACRAWWTGGAWEGPGGPGTPTVLTASCISPCCPCSSPCGGWWAVVLTVAQACWAQVVRPGHWAQDFGGPTLHWYCYCVLCAVGSVAFALFPALRPQEAPCAPSHRRPVLLGGGCVLRALSPSGSPLQPAR